MLLDDCYIAYINLEHRKDRREHMEKELAKIGLKANRFEAIRTVDTGWNRPPYQTMFHRTRGAIGCYLSQVDVLNGARILGQHAFVLEDDVCFASDFKKRMKYVTNYLDGREWDIFWCGSTFHVSPPWWHSGTNIQVPDRGLYRDAECTDDPRIMRTYGSFCTYAYIVRFESIGKVVDMLNEQMETSIGVDFSMIRMQPDLITYAFVPGGCKQYNNQSDIGNGVTYFENFSKLNGSIENSKYWWQDRMEDFDPLTFNWGECKR
jgi:GR25 family glycosyltransferase involved in LPS biosynthesis